MARSSFTCVDEVLNPKVYLYQRTDAQLILWHKRCTDLWINDNGARSAFALMDQIAQELEGRGYTATVDSLGYATWEIN